MADNHYPTVDLDFLIAEIEKSPKLASDGIVKIGSTVSFVMNGNQAIFKRTTMVREITPGQICFEQSMAVAYKYNFLSSLLEWLENNRNYKEGGLHKKSSLD